MWLIGFLCSALGIVIGGAIAWFCIGLNLKIDSFFAICTGAIISLLTFEIVPEAKDTGGWFITVVGIALGIILFILLHDRLHNYPSLSGSSKNKVYMRTVLLLMLSIAIHNFPIGLTLGVSQKGEFPFALLLTLFFHSIPEGMILFTPLFLLGTFMMNGLLLSIVVSIPVVLGIFIGSYIGSEFQLLSGLLISFAAGIILMVLVWEMLIPLLQRPQGGSQVLSILIGLSVMALYLLIL